MIPLGLHITNFRSVRKTQHFTFPREPGLYFMVGSNDEEPRLGSNGAGKSTVWDALSWVWFDKTPSGLRAGDVCNWDASGGAEVRFEFKRTEDGMPEFLIRTWKPNTWKLVDLFGRSVDLTKEKDNEALTLLRLDFEPFLNSVLTAQRQPMFLDLKKDAQAALLSRVLNYDTWLDYAERASKKAAAQDRITRDLERELSRVEGELSQLGRQDFREDSEAWEAKHKKRLRTLTDEHEALMDKRVKLKATVAASAERESKARERVRAAQPDADLNARWREADSRLRGIERDEAREEQSLEALEAHIAALQAESKCPTCGQAMNAQHRANELRRAKTQRDAVQAMLDQVSPKLSSLVRELEAMAARIDKQGEVLGEAQQALDHARQDAVSARRALDLCDRDLDALEEEEERVSAERNPYADVEEKARRDGRRLRGEADALRERITYSDERHALFSFWVRGFKELRLSLIAEAMTELEIEVNSCVDALGLSAWELEFAMDRETKGGTIQRGFSCFVRSPRNTQAVPWSVWSGGEGQRLRIAGNMGLADLVRSRTGADIALEVWDEPTQGLSPQGTRDLLECLAQRAQRERRQIWLIDHTTHDFGGFAGGVLIRKTAAAGTLIEQV